jgi:hypothetical protein
MRQVSAMSSVKAFPTRATLTMPGPRYVSMRPNPTGQRGSMPNLGEEATRTTQDEEKKLTEVYGEKVLSLLKKYKPRKTKRVRG